MGHRLFCFLLFLFLSATSTSASASAGGRYYTTLGLDKTADSDQIKRAYRKLAMIHHPDKNKQNKKSAEKKFKEINEAYEVLGDSKKREMYDLGGEDVFAGGGNPFQGQQFRYQQQETDGGYSTRSFPFSAGGGMGGMNVDMSEMLNDMMGQLFGGGQQSSGVGSFGGGTSGRSWRRPSASSNVPPKALEQPFSCSLEELSTGCIKRFKLTDSVVGPLGQRVPIVATFEIEVKPGWKAGTRISFQPTKEFPRPVSFVLREAPHSLFMRSGDNLFLKKTIGLGAGSKAVKVKLRLLDGSTHALEVSAEEMTSLRNSSTGGKEIKRVLKGMGFPRGKRSKTGSNGDLIVTLEVT